MKPSTPLDTLRRLFAGMLILIGALFAAFLVWLYATYSRQLTGDVETGQEPALLTTYDTRKFSDAVGRMETRRALPDVEPDPRNPFGVPSGQ